ncbi:MAG: peptidoglycan DD-metalloendopeptidase family protein [candidate division Zixibacteria bacterium]|nr:peptidoglycan DD-metalloendopeptidase family protein [candidate division Zixibacteria bacterium]
MDYLIRKISPRRLSASSAIVAILALLVGSLSYSSLPAKERSKVKSARTELSEVRIDIDNTQNRLDSLRGDETKMVKRLSDLDERIGLDRQVIQKITRKLRNLRRQARECEENLQRSQIKLVSATESFMNDLTLVYIEGSRDRPRAGFGIDRPNQEADEFWWGVYLKSLGDMSLKNLSEARDSSVWARKALENVVESSAEAARLKRKKTVSASITLSKKEKSKKSLTKIRQEREKEADRLLYLTEASRQMADLVARLEKKERDRRGSADSWRMPSTGLFLALKGKLKAPIQGKISSHFGWSTDPVTNLRSFSSGIVIQGKPNYNVRVVAPGKVAYVGSLRGYDNFVIVEHEDGFYTTYGGLGRVKVSLDQYLKVREPVGVTTDGIVKFEIRSGKESVDPVEWLDFSSLR